MLMSMLVQCKDLEKFAHLAQEAAVLAETTSNASKA